MKLIFLPFALLLILTCCTPSSKDSSDSNTAQTTQPETTTPPPATTTSSSKSQSNVPASQRVTLDDKGVGPIQSVDIPSTIDQAMAKRGEEVFKINCTICHKVEGDLIGPQMKGVVERRSPEWIMNMILKPELMVKQDPTAKDLLVEYKNSPMTNQNITETQARELLEYLRTL